VLIEAVNLQINDWFVLIAGQRYKENGWRRRVCIGFGKWAIIKNPCYDVAGIFYCGLVHAPIRGEDWPEASEKKTRPNGACKRTFFT
jgi:hypothetical protein